THTDAQGRFSLDSRDVSPEHVDSISIDGGSWTSYEQSDELWPHLLVEHAGFATEDVQIGSARSGLAEAGGIVLHEGLRVAGRLVDPHGAGVADAALFVHSPQKAEQGRQQLGKLQVLRITARSDAAGRFRLDGVPFGPWELASEPAGFAPLDHDVRA